MPDPWTPVATLVWNMITKLVGAYGAQKKGFFTTHVEPLQVQLLSIHRDYISGFEEARKIIRENAAPDVDVWEFLRERRRDKEAERDLTRSLAAELEKVRRRFLGDSTWIAVEEYTIAGVIPKPCVAGLWLPGEPPGHRTTGVRGTATKYSNRGNRERPTSTERCRSTSHGALSNFAAGSSHRVGPGFDPPAPPSLVGRPPGQRHRTSAVWPRPSTPLGDVTA
jgi:hypothetical protein